MATQDADSDATLTLPSVTPYVESGPLVDRTKASQRIEDERAANPGLTWPSIRRFCRVGFSEFMGTFILVLFGDGGQAQVLLSNDSKGTYQASSWGWGVGLMLGVYVAGASGSHINPCVTLTNCILRGFSWKLLPIYWISQLLGAMAGAAVVYGNYKSAIRVYEGGPGIYTVPGYSTNATAGIFATYPSEFMDTAGSFFNEFICSALLMFLIYALKDAANLGAGNLTPLALFFVMFGISACFGWETGFAMNTARDFGPRLVTYMIGYGTNVWRASGYYFWIPMVAPFCGCAFGGTLYDLLLFTGQSPINQKYFGLYWLIPSLGRKYKNNPYWEDGKWKQEVAV